MSIVNTSIKRPIFVTCSMLIIIVLGIISFKKMSVDLFPNVNIPVIFVMTSYEGAGPAEIESLITKPLEEEISTISGIKRLNSRSLKDSSQVIVTFYQNVDIKYAEQQLRDRINRAKYKLPEDVKDPVIRKVDPADQPIITIALDANLGQGELYDLANDFVKPRIEQANDVGLVEIIGGRKREIHILLDIQKMKQRQLSLSEIERQLRMSGKKVGIGTRDRGNQELFFTSDNELSDIEQVKNLVVSFYGNEKITRIKDIAEVVDTLEDEKSRALFNGKKSLFIDIYRQSDSNLVAVSDAVNVELKKISSQINQMNGNPKITIFKDASKYIRDNISDVYESITISLILTIIVVFLFLANVRSTFITAISLPIALISAFILMYVANFSLNVISLLALSLAVGLLVDDAIVVTENIYRKIEEGMTPKEASIKATNEILLAVIAITLVVISVFTPVAFMKGTVGEFMKQFGLTMSFAMIVSFFVAITIIPVLCAYLSGTKKIEQKEGSITKKILQSFNNFQNKLEQYYEKILTFSINRPIVIITIIIAIFVSSIFALKFVPKNFLPENDNGEIVVSLELEADANINYTNRIANEIDEVIRSNKEVLLTAYSVGFYGSSQSNRSNFYVKLKPSNERDIKTSDFKNRLREQLKIFKIANPIVKDYDPAGTGFRGQPFNLLLISPNQKILEENALKVIEKLRSDPRLKEVDTSNKSTRLEFKVNLKEDKAKLYGTNSQLVGEELRGYIEGYKATKFKQNDKEYDVRLRLQENQNDLLKNFNQIYVSNINQKLIKLSDISTINQARAPADINRQDRGRYIQISANLAPKVGLGNIIDEITNELNDGKFKLPPEVRFTFVGESENMKDLQESTGVVIGLGILFIYLILSSLYESFITPFTILLSLPLALCGAFIALFITQQSFNIFTILGIFLLIGVSSKNSILLIDFANQAIAQGKSRAEAILIAGKTRLRPILMTSFALIAGTVPIAIGLSEASKPRIAMGIAIIGGMISSTIFSLVLVPAIFSYVDRFRVWIKEKLSQFIG
ncbi:MAG: efflux RND transporter permease subunit [Rickettsiales bacterium]|nr:efflux RND transporter permease subunit [Rickettsiales bacterium]